MNWRWRRTNNSARRSAYERLASKLNEVVLMTSELSIPEQGKNRSKILLEGVRSTELSNLVTQIRNRGADAFVVLDTNFAAGVDLLSRQKDAVANSDWVWDTAEEAEPTSADVSGPTVQLFETATWPYSMPPMRAVWRENPPPGKTKFWAS